MFEEFAEELVSRVYPHLAGQPERRLVVEAMTEEIETGFHSEFHSSLTDEQRHTLRMLSIRKDPAIADFLVSVGYHETFETFKQQYAADRLSDDSSSLMPEGGSRALSTVRLRDEDELETPDKPPPLPPPPPPTTGSGRITINMGRRPSKES